MQAESAARETEESSRDLLLKAQASWRKIRSGVSCLMEPFWACFKRVTPCRDKPCDFEKPFENFGEIRNILLFRRILLGISEKSTTFW